MTPRYQIKEKCEKEHCIKESCSSGQYAYYREKQKQEYVSKCKRGTENRCMISYSEYTTARE